MVSLEKGWVFSDASLKIDGVTRTFALYYTSRIKQTSQTERPADSPSSPGRSSGHLTSSAVHPVLLSGGKTLNVSTQPRSSVAGSSGSSTLKWL